MRKFVYAISFCVCIAGPVALFGQTNPVFFTQQKGATLGFHVAGDNAHIVADVYALSGKHIARVLDRVVSHGDYSLVPFAGYNLPQQAYIIRLSNGMQNEFVRMINLGNESGSNLRSVRTSSARLAKVAGSNQKVVKTYQSKEIGAGVYLNQVFNDVDAAGVCRGFRIHVNNDANYYVSAWMQGLLGSSQAVLVDGQTASSGRTLMQKQGWQATSVVDNSTMTSPITIHLSSGDHVITFNDKGPGIPDVEYIRLGKTQGDVLISDTAFQNNLSAIKAFAASHPVQPISSDSVEATISPLYTPPPRNDPLYDYTGYLNQPFSYTYRGWFDFNTGDQPTFSVQNATTNCVMYLYNPYDLTPNTSWFGFNSISVTIPEAGSYIVLVRAYYSGYSGTADLYLNGSLYQSGIIVAGNYYNSALSKTGTLNYFTCNPPNNPYTTDTYIFITRYFRYAPIAAWNDDYVGLGNFSWGYWSRCKVDLSNWSDPHGQVFIIGSAYSSYGNGNCDFYLCNEAANYDTTYFFNLKKDDAMESAEENGNYNCFSWSGGRTDLGGDFTPEFATSPWYDPRGSKQCFDNFYADTPVARFSGAMIYRPTSDASLSVVDLYQGMQQQYTHATVRKPGDDFSHGYDWESKMSTGERIFHPRYALSGGWWGSVSAYYKYSGTKAQTVATKGNTLASPISLDSSDIKKIDDLSGNIDDKTKIAFDSLYTSWKTTWSSPDLKIQSNPNMFFYSKDYLLFAAFCVSKGKAIIPLCMKKYLEGDYLAGYAIYKLGLIAHNDKIMETVRSNSEQGKISADGFFMIDRQGNGWIRYFKILLDQEL